MSVEKKTVYLNCPGCGKVLELMIKTSVDTTIGDLKLAVLFNGERGAKEDAGKDADDPVGIDDERAVQDEADDMPGDGPEQLDDFETPNET